MTSQSTSRDFGARLPTEDNRSRSQTLEDLQHEMEEAQITIRRLTRELLKEQNRHAQTTDAYNKTVANMVEIVQENTLLANELHRLKQNSKREPGALNNLPLHPTPVEARAIRKAMARLHHPDLGGDEQRMKAWNTLLDRYETAE